MGRDQSLPPETMIGSFLYQASPSEDVISLQLKWSGEERQGRIHVPQDVADRLKSVSIPVNADEQMKLSLALGYCVTLAAMSKSALRVCGDTSAWPEEWGPLAQAH